VEESLSAGLCGASRPGHFPGVTTVVAKLFNLVLPDVAVFGQKDGQQVRVIQRMARDLDFAVKIVVAPTRREDDGLALSSRNAYLSDEERRQAVCLFEALQLAGRLFRQGERRTRVLSDAMRELLAGYPLARPEYVEIVDHDTLQPVEEIRGPVMVALCARLGRTRLIDNAVLAG
jgi:pantoate--beta-alanine ligase